MVSFIIPAYNAEGHIRKCLASIAKQTSRDFELIIVNDGSTDSTAHILDEFKANNRDLDIKIFTTENQGHALARNYGIAKASKEYIWFVDADDVLYDEKSLAKTIADLEKETPDIMIFSVFETDYKYRNKVWNYSIRKRVTNIKKKPRLFFMQNWSWNKPIKRSFLLETGILFPDLKMFEDIYFFVDLYQKAKTIYITNEIRYIYVKHPNALTSSLNNFESYPRALLYELKAYFKVLFRLK
ncbi:glycosyltransferase [Erysipelotrichaceae bacterium OttesenSCG-928-M19]|nr:glycosyltransferase [Erysipelotrichaceae bacterium OttesenSCG-928-M19]